MGLNANGFGVIVEQLCQYTKHHWIVNFKRMKSELHYGNHVWKIHLKEAVF